LLLLLLFFLLLFAVIMYGVGSCFDDSFFVDENSIKKFK